MRIAYQGEPGAFSEAASRLVSADAALVPCKSFEDVFAAVAGGPAHYGVLPIENSIGGSIHRNFDLMLEHEIPIVGELEVAVVHHLLALPGVALGQVKRVYSHPQAWPLCSPAGPWCANGLARARRRAWTTSRPSSMGRAAGR